MTTNFVLHHADHGITGDQINHIQEALVKNTENGFFMTEIIIPEELGTVPCSLYGPLMDDGDVPRAAVKMIKRSEDRPADPLLVGFKTRPVDYVQVIGIRDMKADSFQLFTIYGGPAAPRNPLDESIETDKERLEAQEFWASHALAS